MRAQNYIEASGWTTSQMAREILKYDGAYETWAQDFIDNQDWEDVEDLTVQDFIIYATHLRDMGVLREEQER